MGARIWSSRYYIVQSPLHLLRLIILLYRIIEFQYGDRDVKMRLKWGWLIRLELSHRSRTHIYSTCHIHCWCYCSSCFFQAAWVLIKFLTKSSSLGTFVVDCVYKNCLCNAMLLLNIPCSVCKSKIIYENTFIVMQLDMYYRYNNISYK